MQFLLGLAAAAAVAAVAVATNTKSVSDGRWLCVQYDNKSFASRRIIIIIIIIHSFIYCRIYGEITFQLCVHIDVAMGLWRFWNLCFRSWCHTTCMVHALRHSPNHSKCFEIIYLCHRDHHHSSMLMATNGRCRTVSETREREREKERSHRSDWWLISHHAICSRRISLNRISASSHIQWMIVTKISRLGLHHSCTHVMLFSIQLNRPVVYKIN